MKRSLITVAAAIALLLSACGSDVADPSSKSETSAAAIVAEGFTLPDYAGKTLDIAMTDMKANDITAKSVDTVDDKSVLSPKNWVIETHEPAAGTIVAKGGTVTFKVSKPGAAEAKKEADKASTAAKAEGEKAAAAAKVDAEKSAAEAAAKPTATSTGLEVAEARTACEAYAKEQFPFGVKMHWIIGRLAEEIQEDQWFLKVEATVTNAYGAKEKGVNVECLVAGTKDVGIVSAFNAY